MLLIGRFAENALLDRVHVDQREMGCSAMTVYVLIAVLAIVVYLSVTGDGTGRPEKRGR
jgi:hypothetical protein